MQFNSEQQRFIKEILDRPIAYHRIFARLTGSVSTGVFLSQAYYWSLRTKDPDGWFYKIQEEWEEETCLGRKQQETARKRLIQLGFWEERRCDVPAKLYYRLDIGKLYGAIWTFLNVHKGQTVDSKDLPQIAQKGQSRLSKKGNLVAQNGHSMTEITTHRVRAQSSSLRERIPLDIPSVSRVENDLVNRPVESADISARSQDNPEILKTEAPPTCASRESRRHPGQLWIADKDSAQGSLFCAELPQVEAKTALATRDTFSGDLVQPCPVSAAKRPIASSSKKPVLESDPRATHPAIAAVRDLAKRFPNKELWDEIIVTIGDKPDSERLQNCYRELLKRGGNKNSWYWAIDWYRDGIPQLNFKPKQNKEKIYEQGRELAKFTAGLGKRPKPAF